MTTFRTFSSKAVQTTIILVHTKIDDLGKATASASRSDLGGAKVTREFKCNYIIANTAITFFKSTSVCSA